MPRVSKSSPFARPPHERILGRRILIACEGKKTEYGYFEDIRKSLRMKPNKIIVLKPEGSDPLSIVRQAQEERDYQKQKDEWIEGDVVWAVFDGDEHIANNPENWHRAIEFAQANQIQLAVSNPSFEYWYLLHYKDQNSYLTRQEAVRMLKGYISKYAKSNVLYQNELQPHTTKAIARAMQIERAAEISKLPAYCNPCTHVWKLVETILSLKIEAS